MENNDSNEVAYLLKDGKFTKVYVNQDSVSFCARVTSNRIII